MTTTLSLPEALAGAATWDAVVVGAGPAGIVAARQLASLGHRVLLVEKKAFPRAKVCGGCLNARAVSALASASLDHLLPSLGAAPLDQLEIRAFGSQVRLALPASCAVSRISFDEALVQEALAAGVEFLPLVSAQVGDLVSGSNLRSVRLQYKTGERIVQAKVVIAADGLQHACLAALRSFSSHINDSSHIGFGATFADDTYDLPPRMVRMCVARDGYVGIVRVEKQMLNVAAAVSPALLRQCGSPKQAIAALMSQVDLPVPCCQPTDAWHGTPALTRTSQQLAEERLFLIGDATGYVEPFTGEGMSWALESALEVAPLADACIQQALSPELLAARWQSAHRIRMRRRQATCRWIAWALRRPACVRLGLTMAWMFPSIANRIVWEMNRPLESGTVRISASLATPCPL